MSLRRDVVVLSLVFFAAPAAALAQRASTGAVTGRVVDSSGGVLPGVTVSLKSPEALGDYSAITDAEGMYRVVNLPPATYEIRAELSSFQTVVRRAAVQVNGVTQIDFTLSPGGIAETITVTGQTTIVDPERAGLSVNINNIALTSVPVTTSRQFQDVWLMVPGLNIRPDTLSANGSERRTSLDGMDVTDPYSGDLFAVNLNYDAVQDVEVKALGAEAADATSMAGQSMNIVTKSGGNDLHGSVAFFEIPERFNGTNVQGIAANRRTDMQPTATLGGPIRRDRMWFFGSYRRVQTDQTFNNAPVPAQNRGNLWFGKVTTQLRRDHRLQVSIQLDRTTQRNAIVRGSVAGAGGTAGDGSGVVGSASAGLSGATMQITSPSAFGTLVKGGPLAGVNYNWVISSTKMFQLAASFMTKPNDVRPNDNASLVPTRVIQSNPSGNIAANLTTIAQEGGLGAVNTSQRTMLSLSPSMTFFVGNRWGSHEFRAGGDLYPIMRNRTGADVAPVEFYFRPPGTNGSADVLFERDVLRNFDGSGATIANLAYERYYAAYFQDRWKLRSNVSIKAGGRFETTSAYTKDRAKVLGALLPPELPTNTQDREFYQPVFMPNVGIAWDTGRFGVVRGTAGRFYEWYDLGGGDGSSHPPYVLSTDVYRATPRTEAPLLNQILPGQLPLGTRFGDAKDGNTTNGRTYINEFSAGWEHALPQASSLSAVFLLRRTWDYQSGTSPQDGDDLNVIRDPLTGQFLGRPFPAFDAIFNTYSPNYSWSQNRSLQFIYTKNFGQNAWGMNASYWYMIGSKYRTRWSPTTNTLQYLGFAPQDDSTDLTTPRHHGRLSTYVRLPFDVQASMFYLYTQGRWSDVTTGDYPLNSPAPRVILSNGRSVADPFFNPTYPIARKRDVTVLQTDSAHLVNLRLQKTFALPSKQRIELSADAFNLFNSSASIGFLSSDARSSNFAKPSNYVAARVGQIGIKFVF